MGENFILEPDLHSPNKFYIYDMREGKNIIAIFYSLPFAKEYVNWLHHTEIENKNW